MEEKKTIGFGNVRVRAPKSATQEQVDIIERAASALFENGAYFAISVLQARMGDIPTNERGYVNVVAFPSTKSKFPNEFYVKELNSVGSGGGKSYGGKAGGYHGQSSAPAKKKGNLPF